MGRQGPVRRVQGPFRQGHRQGQRRRLRRRQAGRARRPARAHGRHPLCAGAQHQGGQGGPARPADPVLDRQVPLPRGRREGTGEPWRVHRPRRPAFRQGREFPVDGALPPPLPGRARRRALHLQRPDRHRRAHGLYRPRRHPRGRAGDEALLPDRQGRRRPDPRPVRGPGGASQEAPATVPLPLAVVSPARRRRVPRRRQPPDGRGRRRVRQGPRQAPSPVPRGPAPRARYPSRRAAPGHPEPETDRRGAAGRSRSQPPVHGDPDLGPGSRNGAQAPERGRRLRAFHPRFRARRRPDAVRHVPCLYGGRAHHPRHRHPAPHRKWRAERRPPGGRLGDRRGAVAPGALSGAAASRHRQGPGRRPFRDRRRHRRKAWPAAGPQ